MMTRFTFRQFAVAVLFLTVFASPAMQAQQTATPAKAAQALAAPAAAPAASEDESAAPGNAAGGGIKIHGHWVLEVKNPDGKVADRREFNNSLVTPSTCSTGGTCAYVSGDQLLAALLSGDMTPGGLGVTLITGTTTGLDPTTFCPTTADGNDSPPAGIGCYALLDYKTLLWGWPYGNDFLFGLAAAGSIASPVSGGQQIGLTTSVSFAPQASIVLSGNFQVGCNESGPYANLTLTCGGTMNPITAVQTYMAGCGNATNVFGTSYAGEDVNFTQNPNARFTGSNQPDLQGGVAPASCVESTQQNGGSFAVIMGVLTSTAVPGGPLVVVSGQVITVSVTISFS
jgi:hypothetical protein